MAAPSSPRPQLAMPVYMEEPTKGLRAPIFLDRPLRGFKSLPSATVSTFPRPSRPLVERLSPLSSVTNAEDLEEEGEEEGEAMEIDWGAQEHRRPMTVKWRKVCATSIFPVLSEAPRRWDGSRQTMAEFVASLQPMSEADQDWGEPSGACEEHDPKLLRFKEQLEEIAKAHGLDQEKFVDWMTDPTSGDRSFTADRPSPSALATAEGTEPSNKKLELLSTLVDDLEKLACDHSAPTGYFFSDISRIKWRLDHFQTGPVAPSSPASPAEAGSGEDNSQPTPDRIDLLTKAVIDLAALVDPLAPPNPATTLMADVVDAYLDVHYTHVWVEADESYQDLGLLEDAHFNVPGGDSGQYEEGFRGGIWRILGHQAAATAAARAATIAAALASGSTDPVVDPIGELEDEAIW